jgi:hypothetical protein
VLSVKPQSMNIVVVHIAQRDKVVDLVRSALRV